MDLMTAVSLAGALFVTLLAVTFGYFVILLLLVHAKYDHLPGPKRTSFFFGNALEIAKATRSPVSAEPDASKISSYELFYKWFEEYGDTYVMFLMHNTLTMTRNRAILKTILTATDPKAFPKSEKLKARYIYGVRCMGDGLATAVDHDVWYVHRKIMDPMFHRNHLQLATDAFNSTGDSFLKSLQKCVESGETCQLAQLLHYATLDVIMKTMFSFDTSDLDSEFHKASVHFIKEFFVAMQLVFIPTAEYNPLFSNHRKSVRNTITSFRDRGAQIIKARKSAICNNEDVPNDFLTTILKAHLDPSTGYDFETLVDEFITMIVAGMETSANTLAFIFMELGRRPDLYERLTAEVDDAIGQKAFISNEDISKLKFTAMLIKESLRKYAIAPAIIRNCAKETTVDGIRLPADSNIVLHILGANNDKKFIEDAEVFNPDRFNPQNDERVPVYSFLSFSLGARNCVGQVFAQMEMKVMLAKFAQHYNLILDESETFQMGQTGTLHPLNGVKCRIVNRH